MKTNHTFTIKHFWGLLKLIRWTNLAIIFFTQYVVYAYAAKNKFIIVQSWFPPFEFFLLALGTLLVAAAGYVINDYYDIKIDLINKPKRIVIGRVISRRQALFFHSILNFTAITIGLFLSWHVALFFAGCAFLLWLYSNSLKRLAILGNITISVLTAAVIWAISLYFRENDHLIYLYSVFAFCISLLREIIKDMEDTKGDAEHGCKTLPIVWGIRKTKTVLFVLIFAFAALVCFQAIHSERTAQAFIYFSMLWPLGFLSCQIQVADKQKDYANLSAFCKWMMIVGVASLGIV
jgi:4-hydroxybenzoate polyprenyltransferase